MKQLTRSKIAKVFALASCSAVSVLAVAPAQAVVMTFESLAYNNNGYNTLTLSNYTENGFNVAFNTAFIGIFGTQHPTYLAAAGSGGSTAIVHTTFGTTTLTKVGGGAFDLSSIALNSFTSSTPAPVTFIGTKTDNSTVSQIFSPDSSLSTFETFNFNNSFTNLVSVQWQQPSPEHQFDNINVSAAGTTAVPEPFTILGTIFGMGSGVALRRKLARSQADK